MKRRQKICPHCNREIEVEFVKEFGDDFRIEKAKAEERAKTIEECKEVVRRHWINGTVAYRIAEDIYGDLEKIKGEKK